MQILSRAAFIPFRARNNRDGAGDNVDVQSTTTPTGSLTLAHWPEYLMEGACLGLFLMSACVFGVLLEHPMSPTHQALENAAVRRAIGGVAMGLTLIALVYTPWGKRSGAHMNPAFTLTFYSLGKIAGLDAAFYVASQFAGGIIGVELADLLIGAPLRHGAVNWVVTSPGAGYSIWSVFAAELAISCLQMLLVLFVSNSRRLSRWTPFVAGAMVALYIFVEGPVSGMSMNPARTFGSAFVAQDYTALWLYFAAPLAGMLAAGQLYANCFGLHRVLCAKLHHHNQERCIFRCDFAE